LGIVTALVLSGKKTSFATLSTTDKEIGFNLADLPHSILIHINVPYVEFALLCHRSMRST
jgi:hypothetical protein